MKPLFFFVLALCGAPRLYAQIISPDTVCVNTPVNFSTPKQGITYSWMMSGANFGTTLVSAPVAVTSTSTNNVVTTTMHMDGADYYGFATNYGSNEVLRLAFGSSPLNTPTVTNLGTFGMSSGQTEAIEIVKDGANFYGFVVSGYEMLRLSFGTSLANTPTGVLMPFPNHFSWPHQLSIKKVGTDYIGFTANRNGFVTRLEWGANIAATPTATTLPNVGGVANPCHFVLHQEGGAWYMLVSNLINATVSRYDFGPSLLNNAPTGTHFGNFGVLNLCRSIGLVKDCDELVGYIHNESGALFRMNFGNSITNTPTLTPAGALGSGLVNAFHPFVYNDRVYFLIAASSQNRIDRREIHALPLPTVTKWYAPTHTHTFTSPGVYNVTLHVDQGFFMGASAFCKTVVVLPGSGVALQIKDSAIGCRRVQLTATGTSNTIQWTFGDGTTGTGNPVVHQFPGPGPYTVTATTPGTGSGPCNGGGAGTLVVTPPNGITVTASRDTVVCSNTPVRLSATGADTYRWSPGRGLSDSTSANPTTTATVPTTYVVTGTAAGGCTGMDSVRVDVNLVIPVEAYGDGQPISCNNSLAQLHASGAASYVWHPGQYLNDSTLAHPVATPPTSMVFAVEGRSGDGCVTRDSIRVLVEPGATLRIPNVFTPNGDGTNDIVYPTIYCDFRFERFAVFNRWGEKLFETKDYAKGWDGRYQGEYCEQGVYTYFISGTTSVGAPVMFKGNVTLLR